MIKKIATISPSTKLAHHTQCITPLGRYRPPFLPRTFYLSCGASVHTQ
jgi:hypothetical protein